MFHIVIVDGKRVRVLEETAPEGRLHELAVLNNPEASGHERDLVADRPGRTASSASGARQAYVPRVSARRLALERWMNLAAKQLSGLLTSRRSDGYLLVATPRLLSLVRAAAPARTARLAYAELSRDLAKLPPRELRRRVQPGLQELRRLRARARAGTARGAGAEARPGS
jgi:hypothetical protein